MPDYKRRCLYRIKTDAISDQADMLESVWAYSFSYAGSTASTPGRYRIRISRFNGAEAYNLFGSEVEENAENINEVFSLQAYLEKWTSQGWIQCLDWVGNPYDPVSKIESELNEMYQAFVTGQPVGDTYVVPDFTPRSPTPKKKKAEQPIVPKTPADADRGPDLDWI